MSLDNVRQDILTLQILSPGTLTVKHKPMPEREALSSSMQCKRRTGWSEAPCR